MALESLPKIAPALFSAEQDLIQIYNKKSDTVGTINASYIGGSTPPSGVSGAIQFSNGSAFASDATQLFWDDTNKALCVGTTSYNGRKFRVNGESQLSDIVIGFGTTGRIVNALGSASLNIEGVGVGISSVSESLNPSARLHIKGSGSTSATNSLIIQNSSGVQIMKVPDATSQRVEFGVDITAGTFFGQVYIPGKLFLKSSGEAVFGDDSLNSSAVLQANSTTRGFLPPRMTTTQRDAIATPATGLKVYNTTTNTTDTYDGTTWQRFGQQTFIKGTGSTSATTSLLVQNSAGNESFSIKDNGNILFHTGVIDITSTRLLSVANEWALGSFSQLGARLGIKGTGSTNATSSLLVQNSSGAELLRVRDDGITTISSVLSVTSYISTGDYITTNGLVIGNGSPRFYNLNHVNANLSINSTGIVASTSGYSSSTASAVLEANSTTQGFLPPRMTDAQIRAIVSPVNGLVAYNTDINHLCCYQNGAWTKFSHSPM